MRRPRETRPASQRVRHLSGRLQWACVIAIAVLLVSATRDEHVVVPIELQMPLMKSVLAFDRTLRDRPGEELLVVVAFQSGYRESRDVVEQIQNIVASEADVRIHGKLVRWMFLDLNDPRALASELSDMKAAVVYLTPIRALSLEALAEGAVEARVLSVTGVPEYVRKGVALGFGLRGGRPSILINLRAARAAGVRFGAQLLRVAEIVE